MCTIAIIVMVTASSGYIHLMNGRALLLVYCMNIINIYFLLKPQTWLHREWCVCVCVCSPVVTGEMLWVADSIAWEHKLEN